MIVDISGNIFEIEPQKKKENNFINKILNIIPFQEVGNKYVAPLEWIYSFKALALKNKITDWDRKPGFVAWSNSLQKPAVEIECDINYSRIIWNIKNNFKFVNLSHLIFIRYREAAYIDSVHPFC